MYTDELLIYIDRIRKHLLINGNFIQDTSLKDGKAGISLFFFLYYQSFRIPREYNFAVELLQEVFTGNSTSPDAYEEIISLSFLTGFLFKNNLLDVDLSGLLKESDEIIINSIDTNSSVIGLCKTGIYLLYRTDRNNDFKPFISIIENRVLLQSDILIAGSYSTANDLEISYIFQFLSKLITSGNTGEKYEKEIQSLWEIFSVRNAPVYKLEEDYKINGRVIRYMCLFGDAAFRLDKKEWYRQIQYFFKHILGAQDIQRSLPGSDIIKLRLFVESVSVNDPLAKTPPAKEFYEDFIRSNFKNLSLNGLSLLGIYLIAKGDGQSFPKDIINFI